jgi:hypothetical protein
MPGTVMERGRSPEHPAFDVGLEDGQRRLFWFDEMEDVGPGPYRRARRLPWRGVSTED